MGPRVRLVAAGSGGVTINTPEEFARNLDALRRASNKPYRKLATESGLGFTTISGYCTGRHLPQVSVGGEFARLLTALGVPAGAAQDAWFAALATLRARAGRAAPPTGNPYRGLRAFQPEDAAVFFGRTELTERLLSELAGCRARGVPLVVVGPSGSGKSSLLRAGLLPAVGPSVLMTPGAEPLREWTQQVSGAADDAVVVVDQFEELFTLCADERERLDFLTALLAWSGPVVLGLRADFYDRALRYPQLAGLLQQAQVVVEPMTEAQLREAIVEPARSTGFELENGLVELLLRDTARESGTLPLLSHTLRTTVELARRDDPRAATIGVAHYRAAGGVQGAIAKTADIAYEALSATQQVVARQLFLRLVKTEDGTADTRRRVTFDELFDGRCAAQADDLAEVLDVFVTRRLLTTGAQTVEIGHEALLVAWPRLRGWLVDDRVGHYIHGRLTAAARAWRDDGYPAESLYQGGVLATALGWAGVPGPHEALNPLERAFLAASVDARSARVAAERRRVRRGYQLVSVLVVLLLVAAGAGGYARQVATAADRAAQVALSRQTAAKADQVREKDPALAAQLALASYAAAPTPEARGALLDSSARPMPRRMRASEGTATVLATAGALLAVGTDTGRVQVWRTTAGSAPTPTGAVLRIGRAVAALTLSADGRLLAAADQLGTVSVWRVADPEHPLALTVPAADPGRVFGLAFSPDGRLLAAGTAGAVTHLWRLDGGSTPTTLTGPGQAVKSVVFTPDGRILAAGSDDGTVHLWDVSTPGRPLARPTLTGPTSRIFSIAISPDGHTLAAGTAAEHAVHTWDITDPTQPTALGTPLTGPASWVNAVAFSPDSRTLAAGSSDTLLWQWDLRSRQAIGTLPHPTTVTAAVYRDDRTLDTLAGDGIARTWTMPGPVLTGSTNQVFSVSFDAAGTRLLVGAGDQHLRLWDVTDPMQPTRAAPPVGNEPPLAPLGGASTLTLDGNTAIGGSTDGTIHLWDLTTPRHPTRAGAPIRVAGATIQAVILSADGATAAVSSSDGSVHLIDISDPGHPVATASLTGPTGVAYGVRFSPDGRLLAIAAEDAKGYLWNIADRTRPRLLETVTGFVGAVYAVAFNRDGTLLAFGGSDYSVRLVDLTRPERPVPLDTPLIGPVGEVYEMAFHPDRDVLAVSSIDRTIWLWDLHAPRRPELLATLAAAQGGLFTVAFSPDGRTLAAGGRDHAVRLWNTDPDSVAEWICTTAGDPITPSEWAQFIPDQPYTPPCR